MLMPIRFKNSGSDLVQEMLEMLEDGRSKSDILGFYAAPMWGDKVPLAERKAALDKAHKQYMDNFGRGDKVKIIRGKLSGEIGEVNRNVPGTSTYEVFFPKSKTLSEITVKRGDLEVMSRSKPRY